MDDDRLGFPLEHEFSNFSGEQAVELLDDLVGRQYLGPQILIESVHARRRVDGVSSRAVLVVIAGADVAEKNLAGMNADTGGQVEILDGAIEAMDRLGHVERG